MSARPSSLRAFAAIACGYWTAPGYRTVAWSLTAGMVLFGVINVAIALWLNVWNRDFFDALEKRDTVQLAELVYVLAAIVVSAGISVALHLHIRRRLQINWRTWLTHVGKAVALLRAKFENELPPILSGKDAQGIREECERAIDEVCRVLHTGEGTTP